jgi:toxin ParE1/3/4
MPPRRLDITARALGDISSIRHFAIREWGGELAAMYTDSLIELIDSLATFPEFGLCALTDRPEMHESGTGQHFVYYRVHDAEIEIVRVLHDSADPDRNLL